MLGRSLGYRDWGIWSVGCFGERASGTLCIGDLGYRV